MYKTLILAFSILFASLTMTSCKSSVEPEYDIEVGQGADSVKEVPNPPTHVGSRGFESGAIVLVWKAPESGPEVLYYIIETDKGWFRVEELKVSGQLTRQRISGTKKTGSYGFKVYAEGEHGRSEPSRLYHYDGRK